MVENFGIFEVDEKEGFVRIKHSETEYEYIVSKENYGEHSCAASSLFRKAYNLGVARTQTEIKRVIGIQ